MSEFDPAVLDSAFSDLRNNARQHVNPPGLAAARATLARRRRNRAIALCAAVVALIAIPVTTFATDRKQPDPIAIDSSSPYPSVSPSASTITQAPDSVAPSQLPAKQNLLAYTPSWAFPRLGGVTVSLPRSAAFSFPIGVDVFSRNSTPVGPATNVKLTIDIAQIVANVEVTVSGPCQVLSTTVVCDYGTLPMGRQTDKLTLKARPGAVGSSGAVRLRVTGNEPSWMSQEVTGRVEVTNDEFMSDLESTVSLSTRTAKVGDTIIFTSTVKNNGPHTLAYLEYFGVPGGMEVVNSEGCTWTVDRCRIIDIGVGSTVVSRIHLKINDCSWNNYNIGFGTNRAYSDPISYEPHASNNSIRINGC